MEESALKIEGHTLSGRGKATKHILQEYDEFSTATAEQILPGSLNVVLREPILLDSQKAKIISGGSRLLWKAHLFDKPVWVYRFLHAPLHVVEILSSDHLRTELSLKDGDVVELKLASEIVVDLTFRQKAAWTFIWKGREKWSYNWDYYFLGTQKLSIDLGATQFASDKSIVESLIGFIGRGLRRLGASLTNSL